MFTKKKGHVPSRPSKAHKCAPVRRTLLDGAYLRDSDVRRPGIHRVVDELRHTLQWGVFVVVGKSLQPCGTQHPACILSVCGTGTSTARSNRWGGSAKRWHTVLGRAVGAFLLLAFKQPIFKPWWLYERIFLVWLAPWMG